MGKRRIKVAPSTWDAIRRRMIFFLKSKNIDYKGDKLYNVFIAHAPLPQRPENINTKRWLLLLFKDGTLKSFPSEKRKTKKQKIKERDDNRGKYLAYIESAAWRRKREEAFKHHGKVCNNCKSVQHLQVHHLTYVNLYDEKMEELMILCKSCHMNLHKQMKGRNKKKKKAPDEGSSPPKTNGS